MSVLNSVSGLDWDPFKGLNCHFRGPILAREHLFENIYLELPSKVATIMNKIFAGEYEFYAFRLVSVLR